MLWPNAGHLDHDEGDLVMLGPPFIITKTQIDELVDLLATTLSEVAEALKIEV